MCRVRVTIVVDVDGLQKTEEERRVRCATVEKPIDRIGVMDAQTDRSENFGNRAIRVIVFERFLYPDKMTE